jgi:cbb3-type cytochrome oxidase subunit 3
MYILISYAAYLAIGLAVTIWVARTLQRNGRVFLVDAFHGNAELAASVNHLLVVGFYLVNIGYVTLALRTGATLDSAREAIELVCDKIGLVLLVLGVMHFFNLYVFSVLRKRARERSGYSRHTGLAGPSWTQEGAPIGKILD